MIEIFCKKRWIFFCVFPLILSFLLISFVFFHMGKNLPFEHEEIIYEVSEEYDVPPELICSVIYAESAFRENALSSRGAMGLMQLMPATYEELCQKIGIDPDKASPYDATANIRCGAYYLRELYSMFGTWELAIVAYNAGMGNVQKWLTSEEYADGEGGLKQIPFAETDAYLARVLENIPHYRELIQKDKKES